ncbi:MAG: MscL family protein [Clostridia bacterium]|nr:MscL family protein [Clostridia bacterium]
MKKFFGEFKKFITRGNVLDMAVGVIVGGAFTAIVNGVSNFVLKPIINFVLALVFGEGAFEGAYTFLGEKVYTLDAEGNEIIDLAKCYYIDWGSLIITIINFIVTALVLFCIVRAINRVKDEAEGGLTKEDRKELKKRGIKRHDEEAVAAYLNEKAEAQAKADAEAAEAARLERLANPTTEDLLKQILEEMKKA